MTVSTEEAALLAAIASNPEDDTPRLVYADWSDENGKKVDRDRAELIRWNVPAPIYALIDVIDEIGTVVPYWKIKRKALNALAAAVLKFEAQG